MRCGIVTYDNIVALELERLRLLSLAGQPLPINKRPIRALHILYINLCRMIQILQFSTMTHSQRELTFPPSSHTSACCRLSTLESKNPFRSPGAVFELVCLPIFVCALVSAICFGAHVSFKFSGYKYSAGYAAPVAPRPAIPLPVPAPVPVPARPMPLWLTPSVLPVPLEEESPEDPLMVMLGLCEPGAGEEGNGAAAGIGGMDGRSGRRGW